MSDVSHAVCPKCKCLFALAGRTVSDTTVQLFMAAGPKFHRGSRLSLRDLAARANYSVSTVHVHLNILADVGLVERIPLKRKTPSASQRYGYKGKLSAA